MRAFSAEERLICDVLRGHPVDWLEYSAGRTDRAILIPLPTSTPAITQ
ncbi:MAG: hypothetical protein GY800_06480, partial [Planctomycetes bacterium]|nr:hypothetical protein [Planctomycetota bacterium]